MAYVMAFNNKYFGLIFADMADSKSYTDKAAKAHRFATEQDVTPEARKNFARVATDLYNPPIVGGFPVPRKISYIYL